jgi:mannosyltransferase OCH1-like enzyme
MIPKIIHFTSKTHTLAPDVQIFFDKAKELHPSWKVKLWNDEENRNLVEKHFPEALEAYDKLPYNIMRVDIVRYMYMAIEGGVYLDLDYELLRPLDEIINNRNLILPVSRVNTGSKKYKHGTVLGNCIFASAPGESFWLDIVKDFVENPPTQHFSDKGRIVHLTGPDYITDIYFRNPDKYNAYMPSRNMFHPDLVQARSNYDNLLSDKNSYGIHHCQGSWLKSSNSIFNLVSKAKNGLNRRINKLFA